MQLKKFTDTDKKIYSEAVINMMRVCDNDFVPPMSARFSPFQTELSGGESTDEGILRYYKSMSKEQMLGVLENGELLGFVTFTENLENKAFPDSIPNIYICTLIVKPEARGKGLTRRMYDYLFDELYPHHSLFTRTWSTNMAHITILRKYGFDEIHRIENDRAEGIDTVYFGKRRS